MSAPTNDLDVQPETPAYRLPTSVRPHAYRLVLTPDLDRATFAGDVEIDITVESPTPAVTFNAAELDITFAELNDSDPDAGYAIAPTEIALDLEEERVTLLFAEPLRTGPAVLHLSFTGILNDKLHGFYRSTFTDQDGSERTIATTQMESTDARRAFPCWDEPELKATFDVTLVVDDTLAAYSNGPVVEDSPLPGGKRRVRFAPTMVMSTYLVAFIVGPLEATEPLDVAGVPLRIVHTPGKSDLTPFALAVGAHALTFFTEYFGIPYPADKLDLVAIPDFAFGAMENLGCVTFRESVLLVDPAQAARVELERVADVVCHEIAHMWFGDLVTMKWWNGIWLNEAFATFMEVLAVDAFRPEWQRWVSFGVEREAAMAVDGLHTTRPVEFHVGRPEEAEGMFDVLTYQKGGSVLRMLEQFIGPDVFREGIHDYLTTHSFGNTETSDLWDALERSSGRAVRSIMDTWIDQGGYPLVQVGEDGSLTQFPFSYRGEPGGAIGSDWKVPVLTRPLRATDLEPLPILVEGPGSAPVAGGPDSLVNSGGSGYYRVSYPTAMIRLLAGQLGDLAPLERYNLVSDSWAAALSGRGPVSDFVALARALEDSGEGDPSVWSVVLGALGLFDRIVPGGDRPVLALAVRTLLGPRARDLGWEPRHDDGERTASLRVFGAAGPGHHRGRSRGEGRSRPTVRGGRHGDPAPRPGVGRAGHRGVRWRARGVRGVPGPLSGTVHAAGGDPLPPRPGLVLRSGPGVADLRPGPGRGPHPECSVLDPGPVGQPLGRSVGLGADHRGVGHPGGQVPLQHPPPHARRGPGPVQSPRARRPGDRLRRGPPPGRRRPNGGTDPGAPLGERGVRSAPRGRTGGRAHRIPGSGRPLSPWPGCRGRMADRSVPNLRTCS